MFHADKGRESVTVTHNIFAGSPTFYAHLCQACSLENAASVVRNLKTKIFHY